MNWFETLIRGFIAKNPKIVGHLSIDSKHHFCIEVWNSDETRILGKFRISPDFSSEKKSELVAELVRMMAPKTEVKL